jgi:hypothetical protein
MMGNIDSFIGLCKVDPPPINSSPKIIDAIFQLSKRFRILKKIFCIFSKMDPDFKKKAGVAD